MHDKKENILKSCKIEKSIEYITYLMILLFYTGKVFEVTTFLIDILFISLLVVKKEKLFFKKHRKLIILFGGLLLYFVVQSLFANNIKVALVNSLGMVRFIILFFALWYIFNTQEKIKKLIYSIFIVLSFLFVDATYQYIIGKDIFDYPLYQNIRLTCWSNKPKLSGSIAIFTGVLFTSLVILKEKRIPLLIIVFLTLMMLLAGNRGPVVYLLGAVFVVLLFSEYRKYLFHIVFGLGIIVTMIFSINDKLYEQFSVYKNPMSVKNNTGRTSIYKVGIEMFKEHPFLGIGSKNFRYEFKTYHAKIYHPNVDKNRYDEAYSKKAPLHVHNVLLSFLLNWGIIGSLIFLYILYQIYKEHIRHNEIAILTSIGLVYCIAPFNFGKSIAQGQWQFYIFLTLAFIMILGGYKQLKEI
ncbi:Oligosaccharide repeat unit polymerase Wzy; O-antigen ligase [hydrothermal vent metagenome]|uniref:Oligosaccharide repeat unit polymerase Wzy O-antigen ligase n=1 Tax=hydrothermal vent metagenome TaxID=652676 RepID=A0A1W1CPK5_9ZZZZ